MLDQEEKTHAKHFVWDPTHGRDSVNVDGHGARSALLSLYYMSHQKKKISKCYTETESPKCICKIVTVYFSICILYLSKHYIKKREKEKRPYKPRCVKQIQVRNGGESRAEGGNQDHLEQNQEAETQLAWTKD